MPTYVEQVVIDGAIHYWPMNEPGVPVGNPVSDVIGAKHGTVTNAALLDASGPTGLAEALQFQSGSRVSLGAGGLVQGRTTYTVEVWIRPTVLTGSVRPILTVDQANPQNYQAYVTVQENGAVGLYLNTSFVNTTAGLVAINAWHHIVVAVASSQAVVHVNGVVQPALTLAAASQANAGWNNLVGFMSYGQRSFLGDMAALAIYPAALTAQQVATHYQLGSGTEPPPPDGGGGNVDLTEVNQKLDRILALIGEPTPNPDGTKPDLFGFWYWFLTRSDA